MQPRALLAVAVVAALLIVGLMRAREPAGPPRVSGLLEADEVRVGSRVGGRVLAVLVAEGASVESGQPLLTLEAHDLEERIAQARAERSARAAALARLEAGTRPEEVGQARARKEEAQAALEEARAGARPQEVAAASHALELAEAQLELADLERRRLERLRQSGTASEEQLNQALTQWKVAVARVATEREGLALLREGTRKERLEQAAARLRQAEAALDLARAGFPREDVDRARFELAAAQAQVASLERAAAELTIRAPRAMVVGTLDLRPGDLVAANAPVAALLDPGSLRVRAYVPSPLLSRLAEGAQVEVLVDGFPGRPFAGRVGYLARQAEFAPSNVQTPEERVQQVFRVEVEVRDPALRPGMSADVLLP